MNWDAIGAIGELLGGFAVLFTLLYLSIELRTARNEFGLSVAHNQQLAFRELFFERIRNPELLRVRAKSRKALTDSTKSWSEHREAAQLTIEEEEILWFYQMAWWIYRTEAIENLSHLTVNQREAFNWGCRAYGDSIAKLWFDEFKGYPSNANHPAVHYIENLLASDAKSIK